MAVNHEGKHHRNPSGCNNKAKWILSQTKWDKTAAIKLVEHITFRLPEGKARTSWYIALGIALAMHEEARLYDVAVAKAVDNYIDRHGNTMTCYIFECALEFRDYIRKEIHNGSNKNMSSVRTAVVCRDTKRCL